ncbi:hypothetical protein DEJ50_13760 [Streptomyces venezuelae]|uniref:Guanylate cyclase domain-containing protein n=1 Tax=Streptomyces venezuelae TaxID=54571 RepID=A0A5P2D2E8_STRVZ|nr:hypothetical protein [Streptomyces venezuelae]QES48730.1 hypothetical protein DEJ50_13760 [Streptomyces venezuelae]
MTVFGRRLLLAVDAKGYGRAGALLQGQYQEAIPRLLGEAAEAAGFDRSAWERQFAGDSEFAVLPEGASEPALVDTFMRALDAGLRAFNSTRLREAWLELRAAVHFGSVSPGANGFIGKAPVEIGRILDSRPLRAALAGAEDACLAVAVSSTVFNDVVREAYTAIRVKEFREVRIEAKEHSGRAWIWVPGHDVHLLDLEGAERTTAEPPGPGAEPGPGRGEGPGSGGRQEAAPAGDVVVQQFTGTVHATGGVFGISK